MVKETKRGRDEERKRRREEETKRRKDHLFETLILYFLRKISSVDFYLKNIKREGRGIAKARNLFVEISFWEMISSLKFPP